jgi:hypothetical protein
MRDEGLGVFDSVKEAIQIGEHAGVPVDISLKIADEKYWGRMKEIVASSKTRRRGVNVRRTFTLHAATTIWSASFRRGLRSGRSALLAR